MAILYPLHGHQPSLFVVLNSNYSYVAPSHGPPSLDHIVGFVISIEA